MTKRILAVVAAAAFCALVVVFSPPESSAGGRLADITVDLLHDPPQGYSTVVCSNWVNPSDLAPSDYQLINAPSGYHIELLSVYSENPSADETITFRFWLSSTDSSSILADAITVNANSGDNEAHHFPIKCYQVSATNIDATDDFLILAYCKAGSM